MAMILNQENLDLTLSVLFKNWMTLGKLFKTYKFSFTSVK